MAFLYLILQLSFQYTKHCEVRYSIFENEKDSIISLSNYLLKNLLVM